MLNNEAFYHQNHFITKIMILSISKAERIEPELAALWLTSYYNLNMETKKGLISPREKRICELGLARIMHSANAPSYLKNTALDYLDKTYKKQRVPATVYTAFLAVVRNAEERGDI